MLGGFDDNSCKRLSTVDNGLQLLITRWAIRSEYRAVGAAMQSNAIGYHLMISVIIR